MSKYKTGKHWTAELKKKLSDAQIGIPRGPFSALHRLHLSEGAKRMWKRRKRNNDKIQNSKRLKMEL